MPVVCFKDNGVVFIRVDAGVGLRAHSSPMHRKPSVRSFMHTDVGDGLLEHSDRDPVARPLAASELGETSSPCTSTSLTWSSSSAPSSPGSSTSLKRTPLRLIVSSVPPPPGLACAALAPWGSTSSKAAGGGKPRKSRIPRGRQVQMKRLLGKMQESARTHPELPITIPPCVSDYLTEERLLAIVHDLERIRAESAAGIASA